MFDEKLAAQFERLRSEHGQALYRHFALRRQLKLLEQDIERMEAGLAELERVRNEWQAQKAVDDAQADTSNKEKQK